METVMKNNNLCELSVEECNEANGGGVVAAVYALGFVMGMSPLGAICVVGACAVGGVALAVAASN